VASYRHDRLAALLLLGAVACASPTAPGASVSPSPSASYPPDAVVLRITYAGGLLPPGRVPMVPAWSLYGDGRVFTLGPQIERYPGPALPNVVVGTVQPEAVGEIVAAAQAAGIDGETRDYGEPHVMDASSTVFRLTRPDGSVVTTTVYALQEWSGPENDARAKVHAFLGRLFGSEHGWPVSDDEAHVPETVAVYATPYAHDSTGPEQEPVDWTGPDPAAGPDTAAGACTLVTGATLATVLPRFAAANTRTPWHAGGRTWSFQLRPLLPDEKTCADGTR
jgi:hypothetical protein